MPLSRADLNVAAGFTHSLQSYSLEVTMGTLRRLRLQAAVTRTVLGLANARCEAHPGELMLMTHALQTLWLRLDSPRQHLLGEHPHINLGSWARY